MMEFTLHHMSNSFQGLDIFRITTDKECIKQVLQQSVELCFQFSEFDNAEALRADIQDFLVKESSKLTDQQMLLTLKMLFGIDKRLHTKAQSTLKKLIQMFLNFDTFLKLQH
jgi:hypothetical protein